jgi:hypothetical protein
MNTRHGSSNLMANRIQNVRISIRSLAPVEADLLVRVEVDDNAADIDIRGRLVGPICPYATTVEVAYPLRPVAKPTERRVVIPEPSVWDPVCPFLYRGEVELWSDGHMSDRTTLRYGLWSANLRPDGL